MGAKKRRDKDVLMFFSLIYFFAPFSIFYILHNYFIPQAMPRAIPQTHSAFYPHRYRCLVSDWWIGEVSHFSNYCTTSKTAEIKTVTIQSSDDRLKNMLQRK